MLDDQILTFNLCCCHEQPAPFPVATCRPLTSLAAKRAKLKGAILLQLGAKKVARDSVAPYSTDNRSKLHCFEAKDSDSPGLEIGARKLAKCE